MTEIAWRSSELPDMWLSNEGWMSVMRWKGQFVGAGGAFEVGTFRSLRDAEKACERVYWSKRVGVTGQDASAVWPTRAS